MGEWVGGVLYGRSVLLILCVEYLFLFFLFLFLFFTFFFLQRSLKNAAARTYMHTYCTYFHTCILLWTHAAPSLPPTFAAPPEAQSESRSNIY